MNRNKNRKNQIRAKQELNGNRHVTDRPPPGRRVLRRNSSTGEGGVGALETGAGGVGALETGAGQDTGKASRAGQATMAGQDTREDMADLGTREAMAEQETREAMAEQETQALFFQVAKVGQGAPWPWLWARPPRQRIYGPPQKIFLGKFPSGGRSGGAGTRGRSGGAATRGRWRGAGSGV